MTWFVLMLFAAAIIADLYIYRSLFVLPSRRRSRRRGYERGREFEWGLGYGRAKVRGRCGYIVFALVTDGAALAALALYGAAADRGSVGVLVVMWLVWLFFFTLTPKLFYLAGGVLDGLFRLAARRRVLLFRWLMMAPAVVVMAALVVGATVGRTRLRVERIDIASERIPAAFDGFRIVQFSDLHIGTMLSPAAHAGRVAQAVMAQGGDMVVATGDVINLTHDELTPEVMSALGAITAPEGVFSVWGNHDLGFYLKSGAEITPAQNLAALAAKQKSLGWRVLSDESVWLRRGADSILLTGLDYPTTRLNGHNNELGGTDLDTAFAGTPAEAFNIVLAHMPRLWEQITALGRGDLTLSGHVHTMQAKLRRPWGDKNGGGEWSPAGYIYKEWSGAYRNGEKALYVNDGIGCVGYPMRVGRGARGEITVIELKRR